MIISPLLYESNSCKSLEMELDCFILRMLEHITLEPINIIRSSIDMATLLFRLIWPFTLIAVLEAKTW